jgi:hypothetical protein
MSKAEPVILAILLGVVLATLAVRLTLGKYMNTSMARLDCRLGYGGVMSLATFPRPGATMEENADWLVINVPDGHFLFSKPPLRAHPMVVRRKLEAADGGIGVVTEGCAFGDRAAYKEAITNLPPAVKAAGAGGNGVRLKAMLNQ